MLLKCPFETSENIWKNQKAEEEHQRYIQELLDSSRRRTCSRSYAIWKEKERKDS